MKAISTTILLLSMILNLVMTTVAAKRDDVSIKPSFAGISCVTEPGTGSRRYLLDVMLDHSVKHLPANIQIANQDPTNYRVIRLSDGTKNDVVPVIVSTTLYNTLTFSITLPFESRDGIGFGLLANNTNIVDGAEKTSSSLTPIKISDSCSTPPEKLASPPDEKPAAIKDLRSFLVKPDEKKEAQIVADVSIDGSKRNRRYFTNNIDFTPFRIHRYTAGGAVEVVPFFVEFRFSGDKKSPVNTLKFGARATDFRVFHDDGKLLPDGRKKGGILAGISTTLDARIETDWFFKKEANAVLGARFGLPFNLVQNRSQSLRITPFVGYDGGYRFKSESPVNKERMIARPLFGAELFYSPFRKEGQKPLVLEIKYITRTFLKQEPAYATDSAQKEVLVGFSKLPRHYVNGKITFNYGEFLSPFIEYTYGREPPQYILIDSRYRAGIQFNLNWNK